MTLDLFVYYFLLLTLFWQTRFPLFDKNQAIDYLIPFVYFSDFLIIVSFVLVVAVDRRGFVKVIKAHSTFTLLLVAFLLTSLIFNWQAENQLAAWYKWLKLLEMTGLAYLTVYLLEVGKITLRKLVFFLSSGVAFLCLVALGEWITQSSLGLQFLGEWRFSVLTPGIAKVIVNGQEFLRPYATFPHPNVLGGVLAILTGVNLYFVLKSVKTGWQLASLSLFILVLFLTFSRSAWVAFVVLTLLVLAYWLWQNYSLTTRKQALLLVLFFSLPLLFFTPTIYHRFQTLATTDQLSVTRRLELTKAALQMIQKRPFFGVGLNNFVVELQKYQAVSGQGRFLQPVHNLFLLILTEVGILGGLVLILTLGWLILNLFKSFWKNPSCERFLSLLIWLGIGLTGLTDHYWWSLQAGQLFFWLTVGLSLSALLR